jgi:hypothetical protein
LTVQVCKTFIPSSNLGGASKKRILKRLDYKTFGDFCCSPDMGSNSAVKVRYGLGSGNH